MPNTLCIRLVNYCCSYRYSYDEDSVLPKREAVISPGGTPSSHHINGRGLLPGGMDSAKPNLKHGGSYSSSHHYQALRKAQLSSPPGNNGAWQEEEEEVEIVPPTSTSLPLNSNPDYSLYEEDEDLEGEEAREHGRTSRQRTGSMQDTASLHEGGWHVPRHKRLRHSTITSLTSLSHSDITGVSPSVSLSVCPSACQSCQYSASNLKRGFLNYWIKP